MRIYVTEQNLSDLLESNSIRNEFKTNATRSTQDSAVRKSSALFTDSRIWPGNCGLIFISDFQKLLLRRRHSNITLKLIGL